MSRGTVNAARRIELPWLKKRGFLLRDSGSVTGLLSWNRGGEPTGDIQVTISTSQADSHIRMEYKTRDASSNDEWRKYDYRFPMEKLPCHFGGNRWFFRCGIVKHGLLCSRRARVLYFTGTYFACRKCADLTYESCNYGGHYKGFVSDPDLDKLAERVKRKTYSGRPTRQYKRFLKAEEKQEMQMALWLHSLIKKPKKTSKLKV